MTNDQRPMTNNETGFTLIEMIIITVIVGILATLSSSGIFGFARMQRLRSANDEVKSAIRQAQTNAVSEKVRWQASFRQQGDRVQWAVHSAALAPSSASWTNLEPTIRLDSESDIPTSSSVYRVLFDHKGTTQDLGGITLTVEGLGLTKRCTIISTVLGSLRTSSEQPTQKDSKFCY
jgi:prepilin-type N-terminal cleavage/methylation domain-containing protein